MAHCEVTALYHYPVKSCRGTAASEVRIDASGVFGDRQFMVTLDGKLANQKVAASLATISARRLDADSVEFSTDRAANKAAALVHQVTLGGSRVTVPYFGNSIEVVDQGEDIAQWLAAITGKPLRLTALAEPYERAIPLPEFALIDGRPQSRFVDVAPILLTNEASLADLNSRLDEAVPMDRFRPNIVVRGLAAFEEDRLSCLDAGGLKLLRATHCERCAVTGTDQQTGERSREPLQTLKTFRHRDNGYAGGVMFGAYMAVEGDSTLKLGDVFEVS